MDGRRCRRVEWAAVRVKISFGGRDSWVWVRPLVWRWQLVYIMAHDSFTWRCVPYLWRPLIWAVLVLALFVVQVSIVSFFLSSYSFVCWLVVAIGWGIVYIS